MDGGDVPPPDDEGGDPSGGDGGGGPGGPGGGTGDDWVVRWTPPASGSYVITLEGSSYDTFLSVHEPVCGSEPVECNDDCFDLQSGLIYNATMGEEVFIVVEGHGP